MHNRQRTGTFTPSVEFRSCSPGPQYRLTGDLSPARHVGEQVRDTWGMRGPMRPRGIRRNLLTALAGSLLFGGLTTISLAAASALTEGPASASTVSLFTSTGTGPVTYPTVPAIPPDACFVEVTAVGGTGGTGGGNGPDNGGAGGSTTARIPVTPGEQLAVEVGGAGGSTDGLDGGGGGTGGGGGGGNGNGGGGGASVVSSSGVPLVVAGGGGGGEWWWHRRLRRRRHRLRPR